MAAAHDPKPSMDGVQANHGPGHGKDNRQYLKLGLELAADFVAMIPYHSGAILMCREAKLPDPEIKKLCDDIIQAQEKEIGQMKRALERL